MTSVETWLAWVNPWTLGLMGLCIGSFLNVVAHRLPLMMERHWWQSTLELLQDPQSWSTSQGGSAPPPQHLAGAATAIEQSLHQLPPLSLSFPRSHCPQCQHALRWYDNIPIVGWLLLRGRCRHCQSRISARYPALELLCGISFALTGLTQASAALAILWCIFAAILLAASMIDWETTLLPDSLTLPLLWMGICCAALGWTTPLADAVSGAAAGYGSLWLIFWTFKLLTGKEGMGYGDFKLLAALGAWLGWQALLPIVLMASILGAFAGIWMKLSKRLRNGLHVPFGPFLAGAGLSIHWIGLPQVMIWMGWV